MTKLNNPSTFKNRDAWIRALLAAKLPDAAARLAIAIAMDLNVKTGRCDPSYAGLSKASGIPERSAYRLVALLEGLKWIAIQRTRGRLRNQYFLLNPASHMAGFNPAKATLPNRPPNPANRLAVNKRRQEDPYRGSLKAPPYMEGERERAARAKTSPDRGGRLEGAARSKAASSFATERPSPRRDRKESAAEENQAAAAPRAEPASEPVAPKEGDGALVVLGQERAWRELRELWCRGWASDDTPKAIAIARHAFAKACELADAGEILAAAQIWAAAADAPRFLPQLAGWLAAKGWERPPPKRGRARGNGKNRSNGYAKPDMFAICLEAGGYRQDADGNMFWPGDDGGGGGDDDDAPLATSMWGGGQ
jgi:hypothetical protein